MNIYAYWLKYRYSLVIFTGIFVILAIMLIKPSASQIPMMVELDSSTESQLEMTNDISSQIEITTIYVDIKGAVNKPGMYQLPIGSRVNDLIELAGGFTDQAVTQEVNLAQLLSDQMMIYIRSIDESLIMNDMDVIPSSIIVSMEEDTLNKININTANESELMNLPGIGPKKAQAIIEYRQVNGSFQCIEDIQQVSGIGAKTYEQIESLITVGL